MFLAINWHKKTIGRPNIGFRKKTIGLLLLRMHQDDYLKTLTSNFGFQIANLRPKEPLGFLTIRPN